MTTILPSVAVLEMTYRCNHACRFCSCPWFAGMLKPGPEMRVRKMLWANGYRFRVCDRRIVGHPDIVIPKCRALVQNKVRGP